MYRVWLLASVHDCRRNLPGVVRQRIKKIIDALSENPRPDNSIKLDFPTDTDSWEPRRIRVDSWRIVYAVDDTFEQVAVLAIRKRPPYDYDDLIELLAELE
ncbi:MAG: type II toxin-antitoxin system RelE/ParE family toxin [Okeania sp. SIO3B5]|uniref:type II toxin-antitoxin system RelE family toxin n=1 Tax=Okeania sp. SIO3B5 TaxID=2607811 RepID=UPI0013FE94B9|nr:type II toxin-antitoxin system RelE/ParE family toxin [Okeania sp. SIO3B5]NEO55603.1 type II toxin-antitoxin system RelE/ParE family toxin [Okeania sp. SIO3B5]